MAKKVTTIVIKQPCEMCKSVGMVNGDLTPQTIHKSILPMECPQCHGTKMQTKVIERTEELR